jgi:hypothetical protein
MPPLRGWSIQHNQELQSFHPFGIEVNKVEQIMLHPSDKEFLLTRLIKLGKRKEAAAHIPLIQWIFKKYNQRPLTVFADPLNESILRLQIIFEFKKEADFFLLKRTFGFSAQKQSAVAKKYCQLLNEKSNKDILVLFYAFEPLAKEQANNKVPQKFIAAFKEKYKDQLWEVARYGEHTTFFFYSDEQLKRAKASNLLFSIKQEYYQTLKKFDEFNYINLETFNAVFDSKENFDTHYNGNWRAYYG